MTVGNDGEARQTAAVLLVTLAGYQVALLSSVYKQALQVVPAEAATWGRQEEEVVECESEGLDPEDAKKFLREIADHNPDCHVQARAQTAVVAFLPGGQSSQTAKDYEVDRIGLPRLVLVGPDGKVAAVQYDLSREVIDRTLNYFLASAPGPR